MRQGKKAAEPALRQDDRGVSRPAARSGHQEDAWAGPGQGRAGESSGHRHLALSDQLSHILVVT